MARKIHTYLGFNIVPLEDPAKLRWSCYCHGTFLAADTLGSMRELIRDSVETRS